jgi:hypothetical protein
MLKKNKWLQRGHTKASVDQVCIMIQQDGAIRARIFKLKKGAQELIPRNQFRQSMLPVTYS